jgi:hypothetical protein
MFNDFMSPWQRNLYPSVRQVFPDLVMAFQTSSLRNHSNEEGEKNLDKIFIHFPKGPGNVL